VVQSKNKYWVASVTKTIQPCGSDVTTPASVAAGYLRAELYAIYGVLLLPLMKLAVSQRP